MCGLNKIRGGIHMDNMDRHVIRNVDKMTPAGQQAVVLCANAYRFGANWGFIRNSERDFDNKIELLKTDTTNVKAIPVSNGALVICSKKFLADTVNAVLPNAINGSFMEKAKKREEEEIANYKKLLDGVIKGKCSYLKSVPGGTELVLGIYSVNHVNTISLSGLTYPAYRISLSELLKSMGYLAQYGITPYIKLTSPSNGGYTFEPVEKVASQEYAPYLYKALEIADSETGVFVTLRFSR